jgi:xylulose-5-phosphate/fructose-6-phosphate phosphoketolase
VLEAWLQSYKIEELFTPDDGAPVPEILSLVPEPREKRLGQRPESYKAYRPLAVPSWQDLAVAKGGQHSCMEAVGGLLRAVAHANPHAFRVFSPDELESNKLAAVLADSGRNMQWDAASRARGGRVIEILSEHVCQGMLQGYTLTGRTGVFPSYESFLGIVHTMVSARDAFLFVRRGADGCGMRCRWCSTPSL